MNVYSDATEYIRITNFLNIAETDSTSTSLSLSPTLAPAALFPSQVGSACQQRGTLSLLTWTITQTPTVCVQPPQRGGAARWAFTAPRVAQSPFSVHLELSVTSQVCGH